MKRKSILLVGLLIALLSLGLMPLQAQGDVLTLWADGERAPIIAELLEEFEFEEEFGFTVEIREIGLGEARDELLQFGEAGEGPDVLIQPHDNIGQLVANGAIVPLELGDLEGDFLSAALNLFTYAGELYGLPYGIENIALVRNVDLVPEAPATWQEVRAISEELNAEGKFGFLVQTGNTYHNFPIISAFGGYIFGVNEDGTFDVADIGLDSEGGLAAAEWLSGMYADGLMVPDVDDDVVFSLFESGDLAMFVTGPWFSERIVTTAEAGGFAFSIDPLPGAEGITETGRPFSGGQGFLISAFSDNRLLAEQFLYEFIATEEVMEELYAGRIPVFEGVVAEDENFPSFIVAGENAIPMPAIPEMSAVWAAANDALSLISQGSDPVESFETAVVQIAGAIELVQADDRIIGLPGSYQDEAGCEGEWNPACEVTFMEPQGEGIYTLTVNIPAGEYEFKVAVNGAWDENYGVDGERDGANIPLVLEADSEVTFTYDDNTNIVTFEIASGS